MHKDKIIATLKAIKPALQIEGVAHLAVFGSQARGDARPESDLDVLIEVMPQRRFSLLDLIGVEHMIQDATGIQANAFMERSLDDSFRRSIEREKIGIF